MNTWHVDGVGSAMIALKTSLKHNLKCCLYFIMFNFNMVSFLFNFNVFKYHVSLNKHSSISLAILHLLI